MPSSGGSRRVRVARGIYQQPNGKYAVCVRAYGRARFRTVEAAELLEAVQQRELLQSTARSGELPLSPRLTFGIIFDAFLVRLTLIPALHRLLGNRAWWLPRPLDQTLPNLDIEGENLTGTARGLM